MASSQFLPNLFGCRPTLDIVPLKIAEGLCFVTNHNVSVGTTTAVTVMVTAPATGAYHLRGQVQADKAGTWTLSKTPNASGGTALTAQNFNQQSATAGGLTIVHTVTFTSAGTVLVNGLVGADTGPVSLCADDGDGDYEWILATSGTYLVRFVAGAAATNTIMRLRHWRES